MGCLKVVHDSTQFGATIWKDLEGWNMLWCTPLYSAQLAVVHTSSTRSTAPSDVLSASFASELDFDHRSTMLVGNGRHDRVPVQSSPEFRQPTSHLVQNSTYVAGFGLRTKFELAKLTYTVWSHQWWVDTQVRTQDFWITCSIGKWACALDSK